jgi:hypothetical protein
MRLVFEFCKSSSDFTLKLNNFFYGLHQRWLLFQRIGVLFIKIFLAFFSPAGFGTFIQEPFFASHWMENFAIGTPTPGKTY